MLTVVVNPSFVVHELLQCHLPSPPPLRGHPSTGFYRHFSPLRRDKVRKVGDTAQIATPQQFSILGAWQEGVDAEGVTQYLSQVPTQFGCLISSRNRDVHKMICPLNLGIQTPPRKGAEGSALRIFPETFQNLSTFDPSPRDGGWRPKSC